jgi:anti-sigma-K factor RskA
LKCENIRDDLEAYVLGALEPEESRAVEAHVASCSDCAQIVRAYRLAVDHLALAVPLVKAPPRLKQRVLGGAGASWPFSLPRILTTRWAAGAAASVLLAFAIGGIAWAIVMSSQVEQLKRDNDALAELSQLDVEQRRALLRLQGDLSSARTEQRRMSTTLEEQATLLVLALDPELVPTDLEGTSLAPSASCSYVWSTKQSVGALTCRDLPGTSFTLTYELWVNKGDTTMAVGTFLPRNDGTAALLVKFPEDVEGPVNNLWVTLESLQVRRAQPSPEVILQRAPDNQANR